MNASLLFGAAFVYLSLIALSVEQEPATDLSKLKVNELFEELCSTCHGKKLEGGQGGSLIDGEWKHGAGDEDIVRSITKGNLQLGMTPWESVLSADQIRALMIYIREKEKEAVTKGIQYPKPEPGKVTKTQHESYELEVLVEEGLDNPWAIGFLPDGRKLVTEKVTGQLRVIEADGSLHPDPVRDVPEVMAFGQGGMLEVAVHPNYASNGWIYLAFADGWNEEVKGEKKSKRHALTAVVRGRLKDYRWIDQQWIFRGNGKFYSSAGVHFGTRIVFDQGYIYFVVGERGAMMDVQDVGLPTGKIFRLHEDGRVPQDNPFVDNEDALPGIWSYGHRNPQGLDKDPRNGDLLSTEHGPRGGDELNLIKKGANYGWPIITFGMNYDGTPMTSKTHEKGMEQPLTYWVPSIATCGLDFYNGDQFPNWSNDLLVGALRQQEVRRLRIKNRQVVEEEVILKGVGRVRDVADGPDGMIYVLLNDPDKVIRLKPAKIAE